MKYKRIEELVSMPSRFISILGLIVVLFFSPGFVMAQSSVQPTQPADHADEFSSDLGEQNDTLSEEPKPVIKGHVQTLAGKYLVSPGDTINISVYGAPEFDQPDTMIRPDGFITIRSVGEFDVAGMDVDGLSRLIEGHLKYYLKEPKVTVAVVKFHPAIVYVLGAVQKPGTYEIHTDLDRPDNPNALLARGSLTVSNIIANAGGVLQNADLSKILIKNNQSHEEQTVNLLNMLRDGDTTQDILVHSGDTIIIPQMQQAKQMDDDSLKLLTQSSLSPGTFTVRVLGKVNTPGVYILSAQSPGVNSAIANAKGYLIEANRHNVTVLRMNAKGEFTPIAIQPDKVDFTLRDNDVVYVDERRGPVSGRGFDFASRTVMPFLSMSYMVNTILTIFNPTRAYPPYLFRPH